ncbi:hypothetical protein [Rhodococcoides fascians]|uniref:hypothetical protein n=1 Tax=Rhodococcoides fascians TaxID=1828 RepID=UPI0012D2E9CA|nr:hypothetical protein [Rhodococcus fascians]
MDEGKVGEAKMHGPTKWWTKGDGLALWALSPHPYTTLVNQLRLKKIPEKYINGLAAKYFRAVFGLWPGQRKDE